MNSRRFIWSLIRGSHLSTPESRVVQHSKIERQLSA
jgi:hypothetical protein